MVSSLDVLGCQNNMNTMAYLMRNLLRMKGIKTTWYWTINSLFNHLLCTQLMIVTYILQMSAQIDWISVFEFKKLEYLSHQQSACEYRPGHLVKQPKRYVADTYCNGSYLYYSSTTLFLLSSNYCKILQGGCQVPTISFDIGQWWNLKKWQCIPNATYSLTRYKYVIPWYSYIYWI